MPVTALDPTTALIVIDLQKGIVGSPTAHPIDGVIDNAVALADAFRSHGLPVVLVTVTGGAPGRTERKRPSAGELPADWAELVPELGPQPGDREIVKRTWGAFTGTALDTELTAAGVTQVVLAGVATSAGVESTARHAHELGYHVTFAIDAMTDGSADDHQHAQTRVFPRIGETGSTAEILGLLGTESAASRAE